MWRRRHSREVKETVVWAVVLGAALFFGVGLFAVPLLFETTSYVSVHECPPQGRTARASSERIAVSPDDILAPTREAEPRTRVELRVISNETAFAILDGRDRARWFSPGGVFMMARCADDDGVARFDRLVVAREGNLTLETWR